MLHRKKQGLDRPLARTMTLTLRHLFLLRRREAAVEAFVVLGHVEKKLGRREALAVFLFQLLTQRDEFLRPHHVDVRQRAARIRRKAEAEDGADIGFGFAPYSGGTLSYIDMM